MSVQYNESDLVYVSRLLEEHGIYYYFQFKEGRHTLILDDDSRLAADMPEQAIISFNKDSGASKADTITDWYAVRDTVFNQVAQHTFDFKKPEKPIPAQSKTTAKLGELPSLERYLYDGPYAYADADAGEALAKQDMEAFELQAKHFGGSSCVRTLTCGHVFELCEHFAVGKGEDRKFMVTHVHHEIRSNTQQDSSSHYENHFSCIRKAIPFRPWRVAPRPIMRGPQTATVVGPKDEEIYCDEYGRIKIQFHWDREGQRDENSSCWVRVATSWAGSRFGFISLPRIGTEVIVDFLEGNPDLPLVTGAVYNAANMPPWDLPANKTQSGIATRSTRKGEKEHANALRFEDKKGQEEVWLHAEKDQRIEVEHDESHTVGNDRKKDIKHDETTTVGNNRTEKVGVNEDITIGVNRSEKVGANETITIGANRTETVGGCETVTITGAQNLTVLATKNENIALTDTQQVGLAKTTTVGGAYLLTVGLGKNEAVGLASVEEVGLSKSTMVGKTYTINAADELTITVGKASLSMKKDGTITVNGKSINLTSSSDTTIKAKGNLVQKGTKIQEN